MKRLYIPFLAFIVLLFLTIPLSFNFATSVIPGWHTTILSPYFIWELIVIIVLLFASIGYWLLSKRVDRINWTLFAIHFILTVPTVIFLKFPSIFLDIQPSNQVELISFASILFILGQAMFFIYLFKTISFKQVSK